ncbi:hypothetical protein N4P33_23625 [Streptomyces sp. 15-116A]|uniref:hypothetical protein n=1 Tax=Streptomyces sp. 15-116A TaxID=2259035 RepID=UPI0021B427C8|nr:hypothetical protein [Streptomyces sp. 15-116A]MCT7355119.1 hypothetical protein [Streptomyces sp. 15-116A]
MKYVVAVLAMAVGMTACGKVSGDASGRTPSKQGAMDEQSAMKRAEEVVHEAVDGMSPKPTLKRDGMEPVGPCAADYHTTRQRKQVRIAYQLTGVPGNAAKKLVRQARDAWVARGYEFQVSDGDWSDPFPDVSMRTVPDDFWMTALTGVVDRKKGEGLAAITVTSPCFADDSDDSAATADPASSRTVSDAQAERLAKDHSSRIYDALRVPHAPTQDGEGIGTYQDGEDTFSHHSWSTRPLTKEETVKAMARVRTFFEKAGWSVRDVSAGAGAASIIARHPTDGSVAQVSPSTTGAIRVGVTTIAGP